MKQIVGYGGDPRVFRLRWLGEQLELDARSAEPEDRRDSGYEFVFLSRK